ncbi:MAG: tRNA uridine-5-carboxymethylaminomethyl(34) synthesis GTPase MnmE [Elusimicrobia bacterium GWA2_64_40]|nr:MAG: tRNA uridine-5-carboxymethylaminomethyl(34) synthesis GTPase MnmE [Elusimicrobia bacterium GWA2_64_40]OGR66925.1 MAG: tRNA uridine-5-carboxymethylaminomethyl(34) synthesis GTPase MnmE [Elusimicrobia bacterium GWB2_63_16]
MLLPDTADTITAQATPPGAGALAVIRISGLNAFKTAASFLRPAGGAPPHGVARLLAARDGDKLVDRVVAIFFRGPASYTGDDTVEITCHGSPYIIRTLLNLAVKGGARPAGPGEFTLRAFLNGKLDLARAEAVGQLIEASSAAAHRAAVTQAEGGLSREVAAIRESLVALLAQLEARLDDSYEEIPPLEIRAFARAAGAARERARRLSDSYAAGRGVRDGIKVVIAGAPNSGKSSLLNALLGYDRAMVSGSAGTTRDTLEARLEVDGFTVQFTDTAGFNARAASALEREGIRRAEAAIAAADAVLLVKDASIAETASDRRAERETERLALAGARLLRIYNKSDLPAGRRSGAGFRVSARTGAGLGRLKTALVAEQKKVFTDGAQAVVTSARHYAALSGAAAELAALPPVLRGKNPPLELAAEHLRGALEALAGLLGETAPEEVLAGIFGKFCVGK